MAAFIEELPDGYIAVDSHLHITHVNGQAARILGMPQAALTGLSLEDSMLARMTAPFAADLRRASDTRTVVEAEHRIPSATDGEPDQWLGAKICPGGTGGLSVFLHDATIVHAASKSATRLAMKRDVLEMIARGRPLDDVLAAVVRMAEQQWDGALGSILLLKSDGTLSHGTGPSLPRSYLDVIDGSPIGPAEGSCGTAAYLRRPVMVADIATDPLWEGYRKVALEHGLRACWSIPIIGSDDRVLGTLAVYYREPRMPSPREAELGNEFAAFLAGIAIERAEAEAELRARAARLAEADTRKDDFLAMLAHELRNPLAPLRFAVEMLNRKGPPELQSARDVIDRQINHLTRLVDDLLDLSRIARGKVHLTKSPVDLAAVIVAAVEMARSAMETRHHRLSIAAPGTPVTVFGDATRLTQVALNLLNNAAKYSEERCDITVTLQQDEALATLRIKDTGAGIAPDMLPKIFEPFAQAESTLNKAAGGLGIGLALARTIATLHGGSLTAYSAGVGCGSEFVLQLPLLSSHAVVNQDRDPSGPGAD